MNPKYLTVSALTSYIKTKLEMDTHLQVIALKGEISNFKLHSRGHLYFSLKDDKAQINAIMFASDAKSLQAIPKDGDQVLVMGKISLYEPSGSYSIQVTSLTLDGIGLLYQKYEALKKELALKGYFEPSIKKEIPKFPKRIGVVTSPTGAVIQDIKNTINRRYRLTEIILYPAQVQGPSSAKTIADQISKANQENLVDVLIVGRGGGSLEDLWGFNEQVVADAIYQSHIPIISAVGHETDFTIADLVADLRAPTPTAAAELATPSETQLTQYIIEQGHRLKQLLKQNIEQKTLHVNVLEDRLDVSSPFQKIDNVKVTLMQLDQQLKRSMSFILASKASDLKQLELKLIHPGQYIKQKNIHVNHLKEKMDNLIYYRLQEKFHQFQLLKDTLEALSPLKVMDKGFGLVQKDQQVISSIQALKKKDRLMITLKDGTVETEILDIKEKSYGKHII